MRLFGLTSALRGDNLPFLIACACGGEGLGRGPGLAASRRYTLGRTRVNVPNIKSAMKRMRTNKKRQLRNRMAKSAMRTAIKKADAAIAEGTPEVAEQALRLALSHIGKTAKKGMIHRRAAARKTSRLMKRLNRARVKPPEAAQTPSA